MGQAAPGDYPNKLLGGCAATHLTKSMAQDLSKDV
jgi:hypothetical protein